MWIVKLGGSLWDAPELRRWLDAVARSPRPIVVVPGGGPFADAVRAAQPVLGFDDPAAHRMAILAMQQYAEALASLEPRLKLRDPPEPNCIWAPWPSAALADDLPPSWDLTSDSIAVWLARRRGADGVVLVKSATVADRPRLGDLVAAGIVDPALPGMVEGWQGRLRILHHGRVAAMNDDVAGEIDLTSGARA